MEEMGHVDGHLLLQQKVMFLPRKVLGFHFLGSGVTGDAHGCLWYSPESASFGKACHCEKPALKLETTSSVTNLASAVNLDHLGKL